MVVCSRLCAETVEVKVFDYFFEPVEVNIRTGDTIEWVAYGFGHTVRSDAMLFDSSEVWGSSIPALRSYKFTFHEPGVFAYYSLEYGGPEGVGMSATIRVSGAVTNRLPAQPINHSPAGDSVRPLATIELRAGVFVDDDEGDRHLSSQWQVRRIGDGVLVYDSGEVRDDGEFSGSHTNWFLPGRRLEHGRSYAWQVRYRDSYGGWSGYSAATTLNTIPPSLTETPTAGGIRVSWPTNSVGYTLETSSDGLLNTWLPVDEAPERVDGQMVFVAAASGPRRFYRLKRAAP